MYFRNSTTIYQLSAIGTGQNILLNPRYGVPLCIWGTTAVEADCALVLCSGTVEELSSIVSSDCFPEACYSIGNQRTLCREVGQLKLPPPGSVPSNTRRISPLYHTLDDRTSDVSPTISSSNPWVCGVPYALTNECRSSLAGQKEGKCHIGAGTLRLRSEGLNMHGTHSG
jgi:hypothetical protein